MNTCWNKCAKLAQIRGLSINYRELTRKKNGTYFRMKGIAAEWCRMKYPVSELVMKKGVKSVA
jgi:hypothetical protein